MIFRHPCPVPTVAAALLLTLLAAPGPLLAEPEPARAEMAETADKGDEASKASKELAEGRAEKAQAKKTAEAGQEAKDRGDLCDGGVGFDDGGAEIGYGFVQGSKWGVFVQRFEAAAFPSRDIDKVCLCLRRGGSVDAADFEVVFYEETGGRPADEPYASVTSRAENIPYKGDQAGRFYGVEIRGEDGDAIALRGDATYIGLRFDPSVAHRFAICADKSEGTAPVPAFQKDDRSKAWDNLLTARDWLFDDQKALMIRAVASPAEDGAPKATGEKSSAGG